MAPIDKFSGSTFTGITTLSGNTLASISEVDDIAAPSLESVFVRSLIYYDFNSEATADANTPSPNAGGILAQSAGDNTRWQPSFAMTGMTGLEDAKVWRNHLTSESLYNSDAAPSNKKLLNSITNDNGLQTWGGPFEGSKTQGWHLGEFTTTSTNTGPGGGAESPYGTTNGSIDVSTINEDSGSVEIVSNKYLQVEATSYDAQSVYVTAFCAVNFSFNMVNFAQNSLKLKFMTHTRGDNMGDLGIYVKSQNTFTAGFNSPGGFVETNPRANFNDTVEALFLPGSDLENQPSSELGNYVDRTVDITFLKAQESAGNFFHWIYFVYGNHTGYKADIAIDNIRIEEFT